MTSARCVTARIVALSVALVSLAAASDARAQSHFMPALPPEPENPQGWIVTPALAYAGVWDDNVLLKGQGDQPVGDYLSVVNAQAQLAYKGRYGQIEGAYSGAFLLYRDLNTLDSYDQRTSISARRQVTRHLSFFTSDSFAAVPTTELATLVGVPFVATGSKLADAHAGINAALGAQTSMVASYDFSWVKFDAGAPFAGLLFGGYSQGGSVALRHEIKRRTTITADYDLQHAITTGNALNFDVQDATAGIEEALSRSVRVFGAAGVSHLSIHPNLSRTGPAYRAGLAAKLRYATVEASYRRSLVPTYSFGGTTDNQEAIVNVSTALARRLTARSAVAWRRDEPVFAGDLSLRSWWVEASIGYALQPWARLEAFYDSTHQVTYPAIGLLDHNRLGFQIVTAKPLRVH